MPSASMLDSRRSRHSPGAVRHRAVACALTLQQLRLPDVGVDGGGGGAGAEPSQVGRAGYVARAHVGGGQRERER
eukprot:6191290-Pleurochrysis_carterae.AAC.6